jgi:hypothetical protein
LSAEFEKTFIKINNWDNIGVTNDYTGWPSFTSGIKEHWFLLNIKAITAPHSGGA